MRISRRGFLKGSLATLFLAGTGLPVYSSTKAKSNEEKHMILFNLPEVLRA